MTIDLIAQDLCSWAAAAQSPEPLVVEVSESASVLNNVNSLTGMPHPEFYHHQKTGDRSHVAQKLTYCAIFELLSIIAAGICELASDA